MLSILCFYVNELRLPHLPEFNHHNLTFRITEIEKVPNMCNTNVGIAIRKSRGITHPSVLCDHGNKYVKKPGNKEQQQDDYCHGQPEAWNVVEQNSYLQAYTFWFDCLWGEQVMSEDICNAASIDLVTDNIALIAMEKALFLPILLCFYAFVKEIKMGEPFLFKYQTEFLNLTKHQITAEIYPYTAYTYMLSLIPIFLLTDLFLYKPTMTIEMIGQIVFRAALVFGHSVMSQQLGMIFYGVASASEVAFFSYIYAILEKDQYQRLTSWTRAATMGGRTFGYVTSQIIILSQLGNYLTLNQLALAMPCCVLLLCIFLPRVHWKQMVIRMTEAKGTIIAPEKSSKSPQTYWAYICYRIRKLRSDFVKVYSVGFIRKWSFWWAMTTCMSLQVAMFAQSLWGEVQLEESAFNGFAEAAYTATATVGILIMNAVAIDWDKWGELALVLISTIDCGLLAIYSQTNSIYVMYGCYIGYRSLYQAMITIAQWNIARKMMRESYGLVFGVNSFVALIMQSILMAVVADKRGLGMAVRPQFMVYAALHMGIALVFLVSVTYTVADYLLERTKVEPSPTKFQNDDDHDSLDCNKTDV
uniref:Thiamine transporter 2 n=1 Tax=Steinernema glaseri TaxID=37863 RepID=A0A1I8AUV5_9BILA